jgi:hypothetical protein
MDSIGFTKIKGSASPYNGDFKYWLKRSQKYGGFTETQTKRLIKQNYICECKTYITPYSNVQIDHIREEQSPMRTATQTYNFYILVVT